MTDPQPVILTPRGVLHIYPAFESCNLDASDEATIYLTGAEAARQDPRYRRDCRRCERRFHD